MNNKCKKCKKTGAQSICSRCTFVYYCSKECQISDWPQHKRNCYTLEQQRQQRDIARDNLFTLLTKKIAGNVIILNAWYREARGYVEVEIGESLDELMGLYYSQTQYSRVPNSHFLHMKYVVEDSSTYDAHSELDKCFVVYKLKDVTHEQIVEIRLSAQQVKEKQKQPSQEWSIMIDM